MLCCVFHGIRGAQRLWNPLLMLRGAGAAVEVSRVDMSRWERKERDRCLPFFSFLTFKD